MAATSAGFTRQVFQEFDEGTRIEVSAGENDGLVISVRPANGEPIHLGSFKPAFISGLRKLMNQIEDRDDN